MYVYGVRSLFRPNDRRDAMLYDIRQYDRRSHQARLLPPREPTDPSGHSNAANAPLVVRGQGMRRLPGNTRSPNQLPVELHRVVGRSLFNSDGPPNSPNRQVDNLVAADFRLGSWPAAD
jgi:hypothetical protein